MNDISHNILEKIKENGLKPKPKWHFIAMNIILILTLIAGILVGGVSMSLIFLKIFNVEWDLVGLGGHPPVPPVPPPPFLMLLPLMWLAIMALTLWLTEKIFVRMEGGYKLHPTYIVIGSVIISMFVGGAIYYTKTADAVDESLRTFVEPYNQMETMREKIWNMPEKGILPGQIIKVKEGLYLEMRDLNNTFWHVHIGSAHYRGPLREGQIVIVLGKKTGEKLFNAHEIRVKRGFFIRIKTNMPNHPML